MVDERLPLLRGRISAVDTYESPQRGGSRSKLPSPDPAAHKARLLKQLASIEKQVRERPDGARDEKAVREIVAVHPSTGAELAAEQLDDTKNDSRLIGVDPDTGTVLLDVASPDLEYLRRKIAAFGDDSLAEEKKQKDGTIVLRRKKARAIAPIESVGLAILHDVGGPRLRTEDLVEDRAYWFEIACRGGYRCPQEETDASRGQLARQLERVGWGARLEEFLGPERVYFFARLTLDQLEALLAATDCIYEVELALPALRDLRLLEDVATKDVHDFALTPPDAEAPSVVLLDTGIATGHPLLKAAILTATTAGEEIPSPEDTFGHGTKMAGIALYEDLGADIEHGRAEASHWLQSSRLLVAPGRGTASDDNYDLWPVLTLGAVVSAEEADQNARDRVFALAVTRTMQEPPFDKVVPTLWSQAVDQIAYDDGKGRLLVVSAGNARYQQWLALAEQYPQLQLSEKIHEPAQAANALTVGAYTDRIRVPPAREYWDAEVVATEAGGISPLTTTGPVGNEWPIKPDVVMEGGNLAISGGLPNDSVPTLCALTTSRRHNLGQPLGQISMTSEATARAARLAARIWSVEPKLWPETVRGLIVHSASWTPVMRQQFYRQGNGLDDLLMACGYGVPDEHLACECARDLATVIFEDSMQNAVIEEELKKKPPKRAKTNKTEPKIRRKVKLFRLPIPETLLAHEDAVVELRVTLSYFAEPNRFGRSVFHGLDLKWDMQGPHEKEEHFLERINALKRPRSPDGKRNRTLTTRPFKWDIGPQLRSRGTVQSDRWSGPMSALAGDKLIAVVPVLGWWDQRKALKDQAMNFSLIVSVRGPGVYAAIKPLVEAQVASIIEV
jgi:hypothetical protein